MRLSPPPHGLGLVGGRRRRRPTAAPWAGTWSAASTIRPSAPSARSGSTGEPSEPGPASFEGLEAIEVDGARLEFSAEAERSKEEDKPWARYLYRQPFGTFTGSLPGGLELAEGFGVMEHHDAHW